MTEKLLQYIWQFQHFNRSGLTTTGGESLQIISPGIANQDQGPDFREARVRIGNTVLAGSIELHVKTSQWHAHGHQHDPHYRNVILHVVFIHDTPEMFLPVLELQPRIPSVLMERYAALMGSPFFIACGDSIQQVPELNWVAWKERMVAERLTRRSEKIFASLQMNAWHWEECFWWMLCRNFGVKVNAEAFEQVAKSIPLTLLARHRQQIHQLEALLFGQAGLLQGRFSESYPVMLQKEYGYLRKKWKLKPIGLPVYFLRMRPGNFPSIRLAQLAMLIHQSAHLFSKILELEHVAEVFALFESTANDYWHYHYRFDEAGTFQKKKLGREMVMNIIINTIVPMLFAYGLHHREERFRLRALRWLEEIKPESNVIINGFEVLGKKSCSAFDSQALMELKTKYCDNRLCLQCAVGNALLKLT